MSDWISVKERLPEMQMALGFADNDYEFVMLINGNLHVYIDGDWRSATAGQVTHWMPLPELPQ